MSDFKYTWGLTVMRTQPYHYGHKRLVDAMLKECQTTIIALGSIQEYGTTRNPFTFSERKKMIKNLYWNTIWERIRIIGLEDIHNTTKWADYVLDKVKEVSTIVPQVYYGGTAYDCSWFEHKGLDIKIHNRADQDYAFRSASMIRDMLLYQDARWKDHVPECNWEIVAKKFNRLDMLNTSRSYDTKRVRNSLTEPIGYHLECVEFKKDTRVCWEADMDCSFGYIISIKEDKAEVYWDSMAGNSLHPIETLPISKLCKLSEEEYIKRMGG